jgi:transcriptional regulator GlxA family with amidase domain
VDAKSTGEGRAAPAPYRVGFVLLAQFSMIAFAAAIAPLRLANRQSGSALYAWHTVASNSAPVRASNGLELTPDHSLDDVPRADLILVCGGEDVQATADKSIIGWLRKAAQTRCALGAVCTGTYLLARAELLDGYRCTVHWENIDSLREQFPRVVVSAEVFEIDRDRYTASGGVAPLDMMINLVERMHGHALAAAISEELICERVRGRNDRQRIPLRLHLGTGQPKLEEAVALMEANLEEPMSLDELAGHVQLSRRQLERLFRKHLDCVPTRYYLELRLSRARQLLLQTNMSIVDVAFACGFVSAPHFSKCYRDHFGVPPRDERRMRRPQAGGGTD